MKKCPFCAEEIQNDTVKCEHCHSDISDGTMVKRGHGLLFCSFCGKSHLEVQKLVAGPSAYICNECIELCHAIILKDNDTAM